MDWPDAWDDEDFDYIMTRVGVVMERYLDGSDFKVEGVEK